MRNAQLTRTTQNMAARRGVSLALFRDDNNPDRFDLEIGILENGEAPDEYVAVYTDWGRNGGWFFNGSCYGDTEDWPNWIRNDRHLRSLLDAIADSIGAHH